MEFQIPVKDVMMETRMIPIRVTIPVRLLHVEMAFDNQQQNSVMMEILLKKTTVQRVVQMRPAVMDSSNRLTMNSVTMESLTTILSLMPVAPVARILSVGTT